MNTFKLLLFISIMSSSFSIFADEKYEPIILETIDNICGDTWCEGDFDFEFTEFKFLKNKQIAQVNFTLIYEVSSAYSRYATECKLKGYSLYQQIIELDLYGGYHSYQLTNNFFEDLTDCITEKEEKFRSILGVD